MKWQFLRQPWPKDVTAEEKVCFGPLRPRGETEDQGQDGGQAGLRVEGAAAGGDR